MFHRGCLIGALFGLLLSAGCGGGSTAGPSGPLAVPDDFLGLITQTGYRLTWTDTNEDEEHYVIEKKNENDADFTPLAELEADTTEYVDMSFMAADRPQYRIRATRRQDVSDYAYCDSAIKALTYIRIIGYDSLWGTEGPTMQELIEGHLTYDMALTGANENLNLVLLGDAYGNNGSIYAHIGPQGEVIVDQPELNTGDVTTYEDFFDWVTANHPGQRYAISYWSHGGGALSTTIRRNNHKSIGYDDTDGDELTTEETAHVTGYLANLAGRKIEVFFACACLTQMMENAYAMRASVKYAVAGESTVGCGCDVLEVLENNLDQDARYLADRNTDCQVSTWEKDVVYASARLDRADGMAALLNDLSILLIAYADLGPTQAEELRTLAGQVQNMGFVQGMDYADSYLDIHDFCEHLLTLGDPDIAAKAQEIIDYQSGEFITNFVIQNNYEGLYGSSHGISIFHPNPNYPYYDPSYNHLTFAADTQWDEYLRTLYP
jgi:hypothetical protein